MLMSVVTLILNPPRDRNCFEKKNIWNWFETADQFKACAISLGHAHNHQKMSQKQGWALHVPPKWWGAAFHHCLADFWENGTTSGRGPKTKKNNGKARQAFYFFIYFLFKQYFFSTFALRADAHLESLRCFTITITHDQIKTNITRQAYTVYTTQFILALLKLKITLANIYPCLVVFYAV